MQIVHQKCLCDPDFPELQSYGHRPSGKFAIWQLGQRDWFHVNMPLF